MKHNFFHLLVISSTALTLASCHIKGTYQCFLGGMLLSDFYVTGTLAGKTIQQDALPDITTPHWINLYFLNSIDELDSFYQTDGRNSSQKERTHCATKIVDHAIIYACAEIPEGYNAFKKNDVQAEKDNQTVLVTPSFYYYSSEPNIHYLNIELKRDTTEKKRSLFSFYYILDEEYKHKLSYDNIRILYRLIA